MLIDVDLPEDLKQLLQRSRHYTPSRVFTIDETLGVLEFAHFFTKMKQLNFIQNEGNIIYGFCYGHHKRKDGIQYYWMFLDENYRFYDVSLPHTSKGELGDIHDTVSRIMTLMCPDASLLNGVC